MATRVLLLMADKERREDMAGLLEEHGMKVSNASLNDTLPEDFDVALIEFSRETCTDADFVAIDINSLGKGKATVALVISAVPPMNAQWWTKCVLSTARLKTICQVLEDAAKQGPKSLASKWRL